MNSAERALIQEFAALEEKFKHVKSIPLSELPLIIRKWIEVKYGFLPDYLDKSAFKVMLKQFREDLRR
ncbi:hypothetical protein [Thermococcus barophilus]|uniref:hypothetical protein n=1 Tax=Thermococcus barophilus TaxID=55802 RepID=UPI000704890C|nr:hypothetical protein [Thermococcus barophilus]